MSHVEPGANAVWCRELTRVYSSGRVRRRAGVVAVDGIDLLVRGGEVFGILGPNGAGKTTTLRMLSTLLIPTSGEARVLGYDVVRDAREVRKRIGLVLGGERGLYGRLTGLQNLRYFAALNYLEPGVARRRSEELLELVGLTESRDVLVERYSRGMRQRLHIARGLVTDPLLLIMDEPTIGIDPVGAEDIRTLVPYLVEQGRTVLLTTHYMLEADRLCDRLAIIDRGHVVACGTPADVKSRFGRLSVVDVTLTRTREGLVERLRTVDGVHGIERASDGPFDRLRIQTDAGRDLRQVITEVIGGSDQITAFQVREPTLEEAYLSILR